MKHDNLSSLLLICWGKKSSDNLWAPQREMRSLSRNTDAFLFLFHGAQLRRWRHSRRDSELCSTILINIWFVRVYHRRITQVDKLSAITCSSSNRFVSGRQRHLPGLHFRCLLESVSFGPSSRRRIWYAVIRIFRNPCLQGANHLPSSSGHRQRSWCRQFQCFGTLCACHKMYPKTTYDFCHYYRFQRPMEKYRFSHIQKKVASQTWWIHQIVGQQSPAQHIFSSFRQIL